MQRKLIAPITVLGIAGAGIVTTFAFLASAQDSPAPAAPRDSGAVVQVTDQQTAPTTSSVTVTTTKAAAATSSKATAAQVQTTEQAAAPTKHTAVQQRQAAAVDTTTSDQTLAPGETSTTAGTVTGSPTPPSCLDPVTHEPDPHCTGGQ